MPVTRQLREDCATPTSVSRRRSYRHNQRQTSKSVMVLAPYALWSATLMMRGKFSAMTCFCSSTNWSRTASESSGVAMSACYGCAAGVRDVPAVARRAVAVWRLENGTTCFLDGAVLVCVHRSPARVAAAPPSPAEGDCTEPTRLAAWAPRGTHRPSWLLRWLPSLVLCVCLHGPVCVMHLRYGKLKNTVIDG